MYIRTYEPVEGEFLLEKQNSHVNLSNLAVYRGIAYDVITVLTVH